MTRRSILITAAAAGSVAAQKTNSQNVNEGLYQAIAAFWQPHEREIVKSLRVPSGAKVLDAGCGRGDHLLLFAEAGADVSGIDLREESVAFATRRLAGKKVEVAVGDILKLAPSPRFDCVWVSHVLHGVASPDAAARSLAAVLKPGGRLVIRENRVSASLLPHDIGIGQPGLEGRLNRAFEEWLLRDRAKRGRYPHGWLHTIQKAGLQIAISKSFLMQAGPDFDATAKQYLHHWLSRKQENEGIAAEDLSVLRAITRKDSPEYFLNRRDLIFTSVSTIYMGTKPA
jgi:SAM-dependent methyltransferase